MQRNYNNYSSMQGSMDRNFGNLGNLDQYNMNTDQINNLLAVASKFNMQGNMDSRYNNNYSSDNGMNYNSGFDRTFKDSSWRADNNRPYRPSVGNMNNNPLKRAADSFRTGGPMQKRPQIAGRPVAGRPAIRAGPGAVVKAGAVVRAAGAVVKPGGIRNAGSAGMVRTATGVVKRNPALSKIQKRVTVGPGGKITTVAVSTPKPAAANPNDAMTVPAEIAGLSKAYKKKYRSLLVSGVKPDEALKQIRERLAELARDKKMNAENRKYKNLIILSGYPGARDDPLRKGLNSNGVKWYLKYLSDGYGSRVARVKAGERMTQKALLEETKEPEAEMLKHQSIKSKYNGRLFTVPSFNDEDFLKIAIKSKKAEEKDTELSAEDLVKLEDAIMEELLTSGQCNISFDAVTHYPKQGVLIVQCSNENTSFWMLDKLAESFKAWSGPALTICLEMFLNRYHQVTVTLPRTMDKPSEQLFNLLEMQNTGLFTQKWKLKTEETDGDDVTMEILIDHASAIYILRHENELKFRFGSVTVEGLDNIDEVFIERTAKEMFDEEHAEENGHDEEEHNQSAEQEEAVEVEEGDEEAAEEEN